MRMKWTLIAALLAGAGCLASTSVEVRPSVELGKKVYRKACLTCHGVAGDGAGPVARLFKPAPRDFTRGVYKFRSTPSGQLPTDADLYRTISTGIPGTGMPAWAPHLSPGERRAVAMYIKLFFPKFATRGARHEIKIGKQPKRTADSIARGRKTYTDMQCGKCHGPTGRGDGPSSGELKDDRGRPIAPYDMTTGRYRGGSTARDIYRTIATGVSGTPMPGYGDAATPQQTWDLAYFVQSLERPSGIIDYAFVKRPSWQ